MSTLYLLFNTLLLYCKVKPQKGWRYHLHCLFRDLKHIVVTPMINAPLMELQFGTWEAAFYCRDTSGRLLGENAAIQYHPSIEWNEARFTGNRKGKPYNLSAFKQIANEWQHICSDTIEIRTAYLAHINKKQQPLNIADLYYLSRFATSYPAYLIRKKSPSVDSHSIPSRFAALYKVMAGIHMTITHMFEQHEISADEIINKAVDAEELYAYIDKNHIFEVTSGHVCGGPQKMVVELINLLLHGNENSHSSYLSNTFGDLTEPLIYSAYCSRIDAALILNDFTKSILLLPLTQQYQSIFDDDSFNALVPCHIKPDKFKSLETVSEALHVLIGYSGDKEAVKFPLTNQFHSQNSVAIVDGYNNHDTLIKAYFNDQMNSLNVVLGRPTLKKIGLDDIYIRSKVELVFKKLQYSLS